MDGFAHLETLALEHPAPHVLLVRLNRPEVANALNTQMGRDLFALWSHLTAEPGETLCVVFTGTGGRAFCAGHDLREMQAARQAPDGGAAAFKALFDACASVMTRLPALRPPVIAQVHGIATAAGCQLVAACDLAVAAEDARFGVNGVNIGLFCSTPMVALSRNLPRKQAFEALVTGEFLSAARARDLGLVNRVVPAAELEGATRALAGNIAGKLGAAVRIGKRAFYDQAQMPLDRAYAFTGAAMVENMLNPDTSEGIAAFLDKRPPEWRD